MNGENTYMGGVSGGGDVLAGTGGEVKMCCVGCGIGFGDRVKGRWV